MPLRPGATDDALKPTFGWKLPLDLSNIGVAARYVAAHDVCNSLCHIAWSIVEVAGRLGL